MKKKLALLLAVVMVMFAFTGCMQFNYGVDLKDDGTGSVTIGAYLADSYFLISESTPEEVFEGEEFQVIEKDGEKWYGAESTQAFKSIAELQEIFGEKTSENDDVFPEGFTVSQEIREGKTYVILKAASSESMEETASEEAGMDFEDMKIMELTIKVSAPESVKVIGLTRGVKYTKDKKSVEIVLDNTMDADDFTIECCLGDVILLPFKDVPANAWYGKFLKTAYASGIIGGTSANTYDPNANLTHAQIMVMAANLHNLQKAGADDISTYAVEKNHWCAAFRDYCKAEGIIDDRFDSVLDKKVTRAEMAYYFANAVSEDAYEKQGVAEFSDTAENSYEKYIKKLAEANIVGGFADGTYRPAELVTRAQASVFIANIIDLIK